MPCKCSIYGCRSNYDSGGEKVNIFSLPKNPKLRQKWINKIPTDLTRLKHPFICIKHFKDSDVIKSDILSYKGEIKEYPRDRPKLRDDAYPCIFPNPSDQTPSSQILSASTSQPLNVAENASSQEAKKDGPQNHAACVNGTNKCFKRTKALSARKRCNDGTFTRKRIKTEPEDKSDLDLSTQSFPVKDQGKPDIEDHQQQEDIPNSISTVLPAPSARNETDEFEAAGVYIATKLRKMDPTQHIYAESLINQILTKGLLRKLTENTKLF